MNFSEHDPNAPAPRANNPPFIRPVHGWAAQRVYRIHNCNSNSITSCNSIASSAMTQTSTRIHNSNSNSIATSTSNCNSSSNSIGVASPRTTRRSRVRRDTSQPSGTGPKKIKKEIRITFHTVPPAVRFPRKSRFSRHAASRRRGKVTHTRHNAFPPRVPFRQGVVRVLRGQPIGETY